MNEEADTKSREDRMRRKLSKEGYRLQKAPSRHWTREYYGAGYMIIDDRNVAVAGAFQREYELSLEQAETATVQLTG
jgi:hypothetical protein